MKFVNIDMKVAPIDMSMGRAGARVRLMHHLL
jgi:hypothetical protein